MRWFVCLGAAVAQWFTLSHGTALGQVRRSESAGGAVTILTDATSDTDNRSGRAISELAALLAAKGRLRVLQVAGRGGAENVRDLVYQRGIDLAVMNSDVLAYLDLVRQYTDARRRVRYVTHLFDQKVYLLAKANVSKIEDLRGRRVAVFGTNAGGHATATAIFGLQKIEVRLKSLPPNTVLESAALANVDAILLLGGEVSRLGADSAAANGFRPLQVPLVPALQAAYSAATIEHDEFSGLSKAERIETVALSTVLAVFDWTPEHARYLEMDRFVGALFLGLAELRRDSPDSIWHQSNVTARVPGWTRHPLAQPDRVLGPAQLAALTVVRPPKVGVAAAPPKAETSVQPATAERTAPVRILASARPPLAAEWLSDGGPAVDLLLKSLAMGSSAGAPQQRIDLRWSKAEIPSAQSIFGDRTADILVPWETSDCDRPNDLVRATAIMCDAALYSEPIMQVVVGIFTLNDTSTKFDSDQNVQGKTICIAQDRDTTDLNSNGRNWLSDKRVIALRRSTILDCVSAVQLREADAFVANDLEGRELLGRLGLAPLFRMEERPLATRGIHAVISKDHPRAAELIARIGVGLQQLKRSEAYSTILRNHLMALWGNQVGSSP